MKTEQTECSETLAYKIQTQWITQKKAYNIQNMAKVWNQEYVYNVCWWLLVKKPSPLGVLYIYIKRLQIIRFDGHVCTFSESFVVAAWQHRSRLSVANMVTYLTMYLVFVHDTLVAVSCIVYEGHISLHNKANLKALKK